MCFSWRSHWLRFQEVWGPDEATYLVQLAKNHGFNFSTCGNGEHGFDFTVSRFLALHCRHAVNVVFNIQ